MDESDFSRFGQNIRDGITDAVNSAMESMDFSGLSEKISETADHIIGETVGAFGGNYKRNGKKWRVTFGSRGNEDDFHEKSDEEKLALRFAKNVPGKLSGTLLCTFGAIGTAGFGISALVLLAIGLSVRVPLLLGLGLIAFGPLCAVSAGLLKKGCGLLGRLKRFDAYKRCIGTKALCAVRSLSAAVGRSERDVCRELESMISQGYFLQGHMDDEKTCLILDDDTYQFYLQSKQQMQNRAREQQSRQEAQRNRQKAYQNTEKANEYAKDAASSGTQTAGKQDQAVQEAVQVGMEYIRQIRQINDELPQPVISEKLSHLEEVIGLIYLRVQKTPEKISSLKRFTDYYLPTTLRLVTAYRDLDRVDTDNAKESKQQIERTLDTINDAFDKLLDSLYEEDRMNIQADISVLKTLLAQEGLLDDGLHL